ncbi:MAG: hypothetical protein JWO86_8094 [Myxococcaceae bacterium]|nr:hypothetical protein [Myxococcaceae bacterium]
MAKRLKRKGETVTFSVSVDRETKDLLRDVADTDYRGNVSELITQIAQQAGRQAAARELLASHGRRPMSDADAEAFQRDVGAELAVRGAPPTKKKRRKVA